MILKRVRNEKLPVPCTKIPRVHFVQGGVDVFLVAAFITFMFKVVQIVTHFTNILSAIAALILVCNDSDQCANHTVDTISYSKRNFK
jgi:hypothetical protein